MMCGYLAGTAVFGAVIRDHTPENRSGMFQGLRIVAQVLVPGVVGPAISAWVLRDAEKIMENGQEKFIPNVSIFFAALIAAAVLGAFLVLLFGVLNKTRKEK